MDYTGIGQRIRRIRIAKEVTQEQLAEHVGISTVYTSHIETGSANPSLPVMAAIANVLDVPIDTLLYENPRRSANIAVEEIAAILDTCTPDQAQIIADIVRATKRSLDAHMK